MDQSLFLGLSSAAQTKTIMNYFPAFFSEVFESQSDALQQFAHRPGVWTETPLEQGAKFMVLSGQNVGLVLVPRHDGGVEFWKRHKRISRTMKRSWGLESGVFSKPLPIPRRHHDPFARTKFTMPIS
jgi:hypothetical protein